MKNQTDKTTVSNMQSPKLMEIFENELKDIYWAENAQIKSLQKLIKNTTSEELIAALEFHLTETENHVTRLEQVFKSVGKKAVAKTSEAMKGLTAEAEEIMDNSEKGANCDAGIIEIVQKVEYYEIATYGTLRQFAKTLGLIEAVALLEQTLSEEKDANQKLSEVAIGAIHTEAAFV